MYTHMIIRLGVRRLALAFRGISRSIPFAIAVLAGCSDLPSAPHKAKALEASAIDAGSLEPTATPSPWTWQYLGLLPGTSLARAEDISDNGTVVGAASDVGHHKDIPFYWTQSKGLLPLPVSPGTTTSVASAISDNGKYIAGFMTVLGQQIPVRWTLGPAGAVLSHLPHCFFPGGQATGVNNAGVVVGGLGGTAVSWPNATSCPSLIRAAGHDMTLAYGINDVGTTVGYAYPSARGFIKLISSSSLLSPLSGDQGSLASDVNDSGLVVGVSWRNGSHTAVFRFGLIGTTQAIGPTVSLPSTPSVSDKGRIVWTPATYPNPPGMTRKGTTTHALSAIPLGVNACGDIVGSKNFRAVVYKKKICD